MQEEWIKWEPIKNIRGAYYVVAISESVEEGLKIVFINSSDEKNNIEMVF